MSNTKSIEDMIEADALKHYPVVMERDFNPLASELSVDINEEKRKAYTAGRLKGIEREKELIEQVDFLKDFIKVMQDDFNKEIGKYQY